MNGPLQPEGRVMPDRSVRSMDSPFEHGNYVGVLRRPRSE